ncbi:DNA-invertase hin [Labrenzia sp. THAF82]|uniref:recombinase family protein n=1 Tax=Labrenzia sp. THAF82 TaxID=2587861 RepID=UPI0012689E27|nr:recombinase family protein [Labrenzia sp. THAF82]QFT28875.1 DNA-invertase hin [Labrenzia sp. THAF82]
MLMNQLEGRTGRIYGYARVSTKDQKLRAQRDALNAVNVDRIFEDKVSGAKSNRDGLDQLLAELRPNDTLVIYRLDRLGRSVQHLSDLLVHFRTHEIGLVSLSEGIDTTTSGGKLIYHVFAAFAEFQRDIIVENTTCGLDAARNAGRQLGRPRALSEQQVIEAKRMIKAERYSRTHIAKRFGVSRMTLYRSVI